MAETIHFNARGLPVKREHTYRMVWVAGDRWMLSQRLKSGWDNIGECTEEIGRAAVRRIAMDKRGTQKRRLCV